MKQIFYRSCRLSIILLLTFFFQHSLSAQCPTDINVFLETQSDVDDFGLQYPNCTELLSDLTLNGNLSGADPITDLSPFSNLTSIDGLLNILLNSSLTTLEGLENLQSVGGLSIGFNNSLVDLVPLSSLTTTNRISIQENNLFTSLAGLEGITQSDVIRIRRQPAMTGLNGLNNITQVGILNIESVDGLVNLNGLESLLEVDELSIETNDELLNFSGLDNLEKINNEIFIFANNKLTSLSGFDDANLETVDRLEIIRNPLLTKCAIKSVCKLIEEDIFISIRENEIGCNSEEEVADICASLCFSGEPCDDGDPCTINDLTDDNCNCIGTTQNPGDSCDDGDSDTTDDQIQSDGCTCQGTPITTNIDCNDIIVTNDATSITISGLPTLNSQIQLFDEDYDDVYYCYLDCAASTTILDLSYGEHHLKIKVWDVEYDLVCDIDLDIMIQGMGCPDADGDGVCADVDCDDNDANFPTAAGTACDDGDADTENDVILADGCSCAGTPIACPDADGDGVCADDDCDDNDANFPMVAGTTCDDGNAATENDEIQSDGCTCAGTLIPMPVDCDNINITNDATSITIAGLPTSNSQIQLFDEDYDGVYSCYLDCAASTTISDLSYGEHHLKIKVWDAENDLVCDIDLDILIQGMGCPDADGDGVCADDDCDDNDANFPMAAGTACDDGDADTENDVILADGCSCAGTPIGCPDVDGDGVCADDDCDDNDANFPMAVGTACDDGNADTTNDEIQSDGCTCVGVHTQPDPDCDDVVITNDDTSITITGLEAPIVQVAVWDKENNKIFYCLGDCNLTEIIENLSGTTYFIKIKFFDAEYDLICEIETEVDILGPPCTDADGDGVCADDDCDDNDANFPMAAGTACDDGDAATENDEIQSDGCTCAGSLPIGDCDDLTFLVENSDISVSGLDVAPIAFMEVFDADWNKLFKCYDDCQSTETLSNLEEGSYFVRVKLFDDNGNEICEREEYLIVDLGTTNPYIQISSNPNSSNSDIDNTPIMHVYPNPTAEEVFVRLDDLGQKDSYLRIYNNLGKLMLEQSIVQEDRIKLNLSLEDYRAGMYIVNFYQSGRRTISKKLIIVRK